MFRSIEIAYILNWYDRSETSSRPDICDEERSI